MTSLLHSLLELGHMTSQNLGFAQTTHGGITFSEETITETNLLELRRRHVGAVHVHSFSKATESKKTGADWEWHIIGRSRTLKMRVQAKRIYKAGGIGNLNQQGKNATMPQIDLLLQDATSNNLLPIYCFYCSESQRQNWTVGSAGAETTMETGCLITDAHRVKSIFPNNLRDIEAECVPWHFLVSRQSFFQRKHAYMLRFKEEAPIARNLEEIGAVEPRMRFEPRFPTVSELNDPDADRGEQEGVHRTAKEPFASAARDTYRERGISRLIQIDVREPDVLVAQIDRRSPE